MDNYMQEFVDSLYTGIHVDSSSVIPAIKTILSKLPDEDRERAVKSLLAAFSWRNQTFDNYPSDDYPEEPEVSEMVIDYLSPLLLNSNREWVNKVKAGMRQVFFGPKTIPSSVSDNTAAQIIPLYKFLTVYKDDVGLTSIQGIQDLQLLYKQQYKRYKHSHPGSLEIDFINSEIVWLDHLVATNDVVVQLKAAADNVAIYRRILTEKRSSLANTQSQKNTISDLSPVLKNGDQEIFIFKTVYFNQYQQVEVSLLEQGFIDGQRNWLKTAIELVAFILELEKNKWFVKNLTKKNKADFFESRYNKKIRQALEPERSVSARNFSFYFKPMLALT